MRTLNVLRCFCHQPADLSVLFRTVFARVLWANAAFGDVTSCCQVSIPFFVFNSFIIPRNWGRFESFWGPMISDPTNLTHVRHMDHNQYTPMTHTNDHNYLFFFYSTLQKNVLILRKVMPTVIVSWAEMRMTQNNAERNSNQYQMNKRDWETKRSFIHCSDSIVLWI